jgi:hypothetical protein
MEDNLKMLKVEYLSNHSSDPPQILNLRSGDQTKIKMLDMFLKYTVDISKGKFIGNPNEKEISRVALLSPACF